MIEGSGHYCPEEQFRWKAAAHYLNICPALSRLLIFPSFTNCASPYAVSQSNNQLCKYCGSLFTPTNHSLLLTPRPKAVKRLRKLRRLQWRRPWKLNKIQKRNLASFRTSSTRMITKCLVCHKHTTVKLKRSCKARMPTANGKPKKGNADAVIKVNGKKKNKKTKKKPLQQRVHGETTSLEQAKKGKINSRSSNPESLGISTLYQKLFKNQNKTVRNLKAVAERNDEGKTKDTFLSSFLSSVKV